MDASQYKPRRLVICADGTWDTADQEGRERLARPTNVIRMARALCPIDDAGVSQIVYYHEGVGRGRFMERLRGGALGEGIDRHVQNCYRFLVDNYHHGDELYLFGFSRGAFTVRSLAGMIRMCGMLRPELTGLIPRAYAFYRNRVKPGHPRAEAWRRQHSVEMADGSFVPRIRCLGVWDTVGRLGIPKRVRQIAATALERRFNELYGFHDVTLGGHVDAAFHAIAIDERRSPFAPVLWEPQGLPGQVVEQVWFPGVHRDVGGGYAADGLAGEAFLWMVDRAGTCGLRFDQTYLRTIRADCRDRLHDSMTPLYRLSRLGPVLRRIEFERVRGEKRIDLCVRVHESVERRRKRGGYDPPNWPVPS